MPPAPQCETSCFVDSSAPGTTPSPAMSSCTTQADTPDEHANRPLALKHLFEVPTSGRSTFWRALCLLPRLCDQNRHHQQLLSSQLVSREQPGQGELPLVAIPNPPRKSHLVKAGLGAHCSSLGRDGGSGGWGSSHQEPCLDQRG